jgi:hypothetical protein
VAPKKFSTTMWTMGEITATDYIERESCGILLAILHLDFYVWSFCAFLIDSFTFTNSLLVSSPFIIGSRLLSQAFAPPQLGASATAHLSILACIGKVFTCCLHQEHKRLPVVQPLHSLCSKLHLGTLLLLTPVVSFQYLIGSRVLLHNLRVPSCNFCSPDFSQFLTYV